MSLIQYAELQQGSDQWFEARLGLVTASTVGALLNVSGPTAIQYKCPQCEAEVGEDCWSMAAVARGKAIKTPHGPRASLAATNPDRLPNRITTADNETSRALTALLVSERLTGWSDPTFTSADMQRGHNVEPIARDYYAAHVKKPVTEIGFMVRTLPSGSRVGFSPDGLLGDDGGCIEIKAPRAKSHLLTVLSGEVPAKHLPQIHCGMLVSDREHLDFVSFYGGLKPFIKRVYRDPVWDAAITAAVDNFERNADQMVAHYESATADLAPTERVIDLEMSF